MYPVCARFNCQEPGAASLQFDTEGSRVLLVDLTDTIAGIPVCAHHARTRTAPVGWVLVDDRTLTRQLELCQDDSAGSGNAPGSRPSRRRQEPNAPFSWDRKAREEAKLSAVADDPHSPLLSRAFRAR